MQPPAPPKPNPSRIPGYGTQSAQHTARRMRNRFGVRRLVGAFGRRLVAVERKWLLEQFCEPLHAALLRRRVGEAIEAATSRRTPQPSQREHAAPQHGNHQR